MTAVGAPLQRRAFEPVATGADTLVVKVAGCGVCHTDLGYYYDGVRTNRALPLALGHEISGHVVAAGREAEDWLGKAVLVYAVIPCGKCALCRRGLGQICRQQMMPGNDIAGGFASHFTVPAHGVCAVDESRLATAGLALADISVVADAVTTPYQAVVNSGAGEGDLAIVVGTGGVGGYAVQIAHAFGATVVAVDVDAGKRQKMARFGAALTLDPREFEGSALKKRIAAFAGEKGLRATEWKIFECSGSAAGQQTAYSLLTFGAHLGVVGFTMDKGSFRLSNLMAFNARAVGNWGCAPDLYPAALDLVLEGKIALAPFVEQQPLDDINRVFAAVHAGELDRRAILVPASEGNAS